MKLLLSDDEIKKILISVGFFVSYAENLTEEELVWWKAIAQAQLNHIFNLDMKTTSEVIVKLQAHLDKLFLKEMAK